VKRPPAKSAPAKKAKPVASPNRAAGKLFDRVATILDEARSSVVRAVNSRMVLAYWLIGREIVLELQGGEDRAEYGKEVIRGLSNRLTSRYGPGYSVSSLRDFRWFYTVFQKHHTACGEFETLPSNSEVSPIRHSLCAEFPSPFHPSLSWSHYRAIMRVEKPEAREFYEQEAVASGWNVRELERQIHSFYYERLLASRDKKGMLREQRQATSYDPAGILKSSAVLEFLGLPDSSRLHESELEQAIMDNLQTFLLEMGRGFSFVARQKRVVFEDDEFFVDLVFYNYLLKCFVLIDLKIGKLTHQDIGQMDSYVRLYEDLFKVEGDNPTIGLILCSEKNETIARYSVLKESRQLFARKYRLHLPTEDELAAELKREILAIREKGETE
jgi:predicted nuclease of restriction endonuclease-like (RecB) superfamily